MRQLEHVEFDHCSFLGVRRTDHQLRTCEWNGLTLEASGVYLNEEVTTFGCDSIISLQFTLLEATESTTTVSECNSYFWNGVEYSESGTYEWLGENEAGCDSVAVLNLTILPSTESVADPLFSCDPIVWNGMTLAVSGTQR